MLQALVGARFPGTPPDPNRPAWPAWSQQLVNTLVRLAVAPVYRMGPQAEPLLLPMQPMQPMLGAVKGQRQGNIRSAADGEGVRRLPWGGPLLVEQPRPVAHKVCLT